jgi:hypothetical protein
MPYSLVAAKNTPFSSTFFISKYGFSCDSSKLNFSWRTFSL